MSQFVEWKTSHKPVTYELALQEMEKRVDAIAGKKAKELVWLLEHTPVYTLGTTGSRADIIKSSHIPIYKTNRGGKTTYHGPGQRVVYIMLNLKEYFRQTGKIDISNFVHKVECWIIESLADLGIWAQQRKGRVGLWVESNRPYVKDKNKDYDPTSPEKKIAAIGLRVRQGISYHGIAINVSPDLNAFDSIIPCGLENFAVTSLLDLKKPLDTYAPLDFALQHRFNRSFYSTL